MVQERGLCVSLSSFGLQWRWRGASSTRSLIRPYLRAGALVAGTGRDQAAQRPAVMPPARPARKTLVATAVAGLRRAGRPPAAARVPSAAAAQACPPIPALAPNRVPPPAWVGPAVRMEPAAQAPVERAAARAAVVARVALGTRATAQTLALVARAVTPVLVARTAARAAVVARAATRSRFTQTAESVSRASAPPRSPAVAGEHAAQVSGRLGRARRLDLRAPRARVRVEHVGDELGEQVVGDAQAARHLARDVQHEEGVRLEVAPVERVEILRRDPEQP